jgi:hypothetical protein
MTSGSKNSSNMFSTKKKLGDRIDEMSSRENDNNY